MVFIRADGGSERATSETTRAVTSVTDPTALGNVATETTTYEHDDPDHCETGTAGRAVVGVTDDAGRVLAVVHPEEEHAVLVNDTVPLDGDWATVAREQVEGMTGTAATLDDVLLVREVEHVADGERTTTHHVLFVGSIEGDTITDGLCETNPWELRWLDSVPEGADAGDGRDDIARVLEAGK